MTRPKERPYRPPNVMPKGPIPLHDEEIAAMTRQGLSQKIISEKLGITVRSVQRGCRRMGLSRPAYSKMSADELARAEKMLDDGESIRQVAETLGRGWDTISRYFPGRSLDPAEAGRRGGLQAYANRILDSI